MRPKKSRHLGQPPIQVSERGGNGSPEKKDSI